MAARILIIEDNPANLELAHGYSTLSALDGGEGVRTVWKAHPDFVLCDLQMPMLGGYGVLSEIRNDSTLRDTRVVAVTAFSMPGESAKALAAGFDVYISKPIDSERFVAQIEAFLRLELRGARPPPAN